MSQTSLFFKTWDRYVLPVVTDAFTKLADRFRPEILSAASGRVLEIGIGSGPSLPFYPQDRITEVVGLEPHAELRERLNRRLKTDSRLSSMRFPVVAVDGAAENIPFPDASFNAVSAQLVFCTVPDLARTLAEIRRVLKPGGKLMYIEHVRHSAPSVANFQSRLNPMWRKFSGGCHLDRDTPREIEAAGLRPEWMRELEDRAWPRLLSHLVWGVSVKP